MISYNLFVGDQFFKSFFKLWISTSAQHEAQISSCVHTVHRKMVFGPQPLSPTVFQTLVYCILIGKNHSIEIQKSSASHQRCVRKYMEKIFLYLLSILLKQGWGTGGLIKRSKWLFGRKRLPGLEFLAI